MKTFDHSEDLRSALARARSSTFLVSLDVTVEHGLCQWLKTHSIGRKPRAIEFNTELVEKFRAHWPCLNAQIANVPPEDCTNFAASIGHFSSSRYNGMVNILRALIPAARFVPRKKIKTIDGVTACPSPADFDRLLAALDGAHRGRASLVVRFLAHTGLRMNEARELKWEDIKEDHIYLRGEITKNGFPRCVPFIMGTREVLSALKLVAGENIQRTDKVLPQLECKSALRYAARLAGIPNYSHHAFRHYFATRCIVSGVDIPTVAKWLGHRDNGVLLLRTYCHLLDEHSVAMARRVKLGAKLARPESYVTLHPTTQTRNNKN